MTLTPSTRINSLLMASVLLIAASSCEGAQDKPGTEPGGGSSTDDLTWSATGAGTELYKYSPAVVPSQFYTVEVNGENAFVIPGIDVPQGSQPEEEHHICTFGCDGEVLVEVNPLAETIKEAEVLPKSKGYKYRIADGVLQVMLKPGDRVSVEINGKEDESLFIFVNPLETSKPSKDDPDVTYYEAGTVTEAGSLSVPSGHTLYIEGGAIVKGNLTCAQNSSDITIKGCGIFDSRGVNARAIQFHKISGLVIDGITMLNDINWTTFIAEGTDIAINNYKVVAVYNPENSSGCENDAIDLLGCRNARVTGCFGYAHDDIFCIKSWKWSYKGEVEDVVFDDCIAWNYRSGNSFVVGAETGCDISGVTYRNCISIHSAGNSSGTLNRGGLSVHHCAGGHVQDILFENITLEDCKEYGIHIDIRESYVSNLGNDEGNNQIPFSPGTADGITLRNINIMQAPPKGNFLFGYDAAHKITGLVFDNVCQEGTEITAGNITTFFDPAMSYQRNGHISYNLTNVEYDFE